MPTDDGPEAKQWGLAASAILTSLTRPEPRFDLLGGAVKLAEPEPVAKTLLASSWNVNGRDDLVATLDFLGSRGHSVEYQKASVAFQQASPEARQQPQLLFVAQHGGEIGPRGLLAWDLGRLIAVAGWGYLAGYCTEQEGWGAILSAGARLRTTYGSWSEYGAHYRLGVLFWDASATAQIDPVLNQLVSAPTSPWKKIPWRLEAAVSPLAATSPGGLSPAFAAGFPAPTNPGPTAPSLPYAPPGAPGGPTSYGGVPVIAPTAGGAPPPGALPGAPGKKLPLVAIGVAAGVVALALAAALAVHFMHHAAPRAPREPPVHEGKHGRR